MTAVAVYKGLLWVVAPSNWLTLRPPTMTFTRRVSGRPPEFAKSQSELGRHLVPPRDRKIIQLAMRKPGCPGRNDNGWYNIAEWQAFIRQHFDSKPQKDLPDKLELEMERLRLINAKLTFELQVKQRDYTANVDIERHVGGMVMAAKRVLLKIPSKLAPIVVGHTEVEAELILKTEINEALEFLTARPWDSE